MPSSIQWNSSLEPLDVTSPYPSLSCLCDSADFTSVFTYNAPPNGETRFELGSSGLYRREVLQCERCGHFVSVHEMDIDSLYSGEYVSSTYGADGMRQTFDRINALDPAESDNTGRVSKVSEFSASHFQEGLSGQFSPTLLDVGSGLCVFPYRMKEAGWDCTALDPDIRAVKHAQETVGVKAVFGDFMELDGLGLFHAVTFNKVLEHIRDPVAMLSKSVKHLRRDGFVYAEVPDGESAMREGPGREEFFIEHWHVFSAASLALLASRAGFSVSSMERLREPSGKYTLRLFMIPLNPR